jgi:hypothetical protein
MYAFLRGVILSEAKERSCPGLEIVKPEYVASPSLRESV